MLIGTYMSSYSSLFQLTIILFNAPTNSLLTVYDDVLNNKQLLTGFLSYHTRKIILVIDF